MGCSSSAQTQVKDCSRPAPKSPDANGLQKRDEKFPTTDENETIPDQTKLGAMEEVDLGLDGTKQSEDLTKEEMDVLVPGLTKCVLSTSQRVDPEGTEPLPAASEEKFCRGDLLPSGLAEAGEPQPVEPTESGESQPTTEAASAWLPETAQKPEPARSAEGNAAESAGTEEANPHLVTEFATELQMGEEEPLTEGETGEKVETEMHCEIVSEGSETKEEMGEATTATEIEATDNEE
ncbi:glutamate-rich protein 5 isoform X2 [Hemicordylus capensis]|uniref:glutamate-rich protein 5 isoform X2 n=1 Tax=Hemicordylus capensis TaxID=884348 RepID=UPI002303C6FC|nr:glutamate-rich protein 5 isoform X2 [Hemicordylus capensis]